MQLMNKNSYLVHFIASQLVYLSKKNLEAAVDGEEGLDTYNIMEEQRNLEETNDDLPDEEAENDDFQWTSAWQDDDDEDDEDVIQLGGENQIISLEDEDDSEMEIEGSKPKSKSKSTSKKTAAISEGRSKKSRK
jgi:hypothetical protein